MHRSFDRNDSGSEKPARKHTQRVCDRAGDNGDGTVAVKPLWATAIPSRLIVASSVTECRDYASSDAPRSATELRVAIDVAD